MFDFIKAIVPNSAFEALYNCHGSDLVAVHTEGVLKYETKKYLNFTFRRYPSNRVIMYGSIHYFSNDGFHNHDLFDVKRCEKAFGQLVSKLGISLSDVEILRLEYGINITTNWNPDLFLDGLKLHKRERFKNAYISPRFLMPKGNFRLVGHSEYEVKAYNKSAQFNLKHNVLRIEIKAKNKRYLKSVTKQNIRTLDDLFNGVVIKLLANDILQKIKDMIVVDLSVNRSRLTDKQEAERDSYLSMDYWQDKLSKHRNTYLKSKKRLVKFNESLGSNIQDLVYRDAKKALIDMGCIKKGVHFHSLSIV